MSKIAVLFPGIGYTCDKPLLYYSAKLAAEKGFEVVRVPYGNFPSNVKGNAEKMYQSFVSAREQSEDILKDVDWGSYDEIVFFSKSVGTVVALSYASEHGIDTEDIIKICEEKGVPLYLTKDANHSLECGKAIKDIKTIRKVMRTVKEFL